MTLLADIGRFLIMLKGMFKKLENRQMYWKELMRQCTEIGFGSLGIVTIISVFIGAVSTIQTAYQLVSPLIPISTIAQIVRDTVILEFAPTLVCVVLAGVAGSRIASELGNMRVSEQIDALEIMGVNSLTFLVLPKILGAILFFPVLIIFSMGLSLVGGWLSLVLSGLASTETYVYGIRSFFEIGDIIYALVKTIVFAFLIVSIASFYGYYSKGGAIDVGKAATKAVVSSSIAILIANFFLTQMILL
jgi:phospholipid/cholesterol/gamma-HCH transport system permease protein